MAGLILTEIVMLRNNKGRLHQASYLSLVILPTATNYFLLRKTKTFQQHGISLVFSQNSLYRVLHSLVCVINSLCSVLNSLVCVINSLCRELNVSTPPTP